MARLSKGNIFFSTWDYINKRSLKLLKVVDSSKYFHFCDFLFLAFKSECTCKWRLIDSFLGLYRSCSANTRTEVTEANFLQIDHWHLKRFKIITNYLNLHDFYSFNLRSHTVSKKWVDPIVILKKNSSWKHTDCSGVVSQAGFPRINISAGVLITSVERYDR